MLDHCKGIDLVYHTGKEANVYNIGGRNERTNLQIVDAIDATKLENELGWKADENFDTGIIHTIDWYLNNIINDNISIEDAAQQVIDYLETKGYLNA